MAWASDPDEHLHKPVTALAYVSRLPGLPGGDGHSGWLVSASRGLLNLWEANRAAPGNEGVLMVRRRVMVGGGARVWGGGGGGGPFF
jgi:hypothetical protein